MNTKQTIATVAVAGAVAAFALLNVGTINTGTNFLSTPMTEVELEFINFISHHRRSYGTKEEYEYRLQQFAATYNDIINHDEVKTGYKKGINHFSDFSDFEWKQMQGTKVGKKDTDNVTILSVEGI